MKTKMSVSSQLVIPYQLFDDALPSTSIRQICLDAGVTEEVYQQHLVYLFDEMKEQLSLLIDQASDEEAIDSDEDIFIDDFEDFDDVTDEETFIE